MKIDLAVYTAQEGYSWQPGTVFSAEELAEFKKRIGKFPSPDANDFPFGGVFLLDDHVVFYRYHMAKKIDFRGRDALYCVLGAVSRSDAAKIAPAALFASPEFAGPMKPFPTALELSEADPSAVPEWLKNLDRMTLDVRISGSAENPGYAVVQEPVKIPQPPADLEKTAVGGAEVAAAGGDIPPGGDSGGSSPTGDSTVDTLAADPGGIACVELSQPGEDIVHRKIPIWMLVCAAVLALLIVGLSAWGIVYCLKRNSEDVADAGRTGETAGAGEVASVAQATGEVARVAQGTNATAVSQVPVATVSPAVSPRPVTGNVPVAAVPTNVLASSANPKLPPAQKPEMLQSLEKESKPEIKAKSVPAKASGTPPKKGGQR